MVATNSSAWVGGHAYTLIGVREYALDGPDKPKTKLAQLRNPWGETQWIGQPFAEGSLEYMKL